MKRSGSYQLLPLLAAASGGLGLVLRLALYTTQNDSGLLPAQHPLHISCLILAGCMAAVLAFFLFRLDGASGYPENFPASLPGAFGSAFSGLWLLPTAFSILEAAASRLDQLHAALAFLAIPCLIWAGWCRRRGRQPHFLLHGVVCLFFAIHMVCQYRSWSGNPQLEDYIFALPACVFLTLTAYYRMAFDIGLGRRRMLLFCGMMAGFLCTLSVIGAGDARFFFAGALWALTDLCAVDPPQPVQKTGEA